MKKWFRLCVVLVSLLLPFSSVNAGSFFQNILRKAEKDMKKAARNLKKKIPKLETVLEIGGYVNIKAHNGKYLSLKENGTAYFDAAKADSWERIRIVTLGGDRLALFGVHGRFASARLGNDGAPLRQADQLKGWEIFTLIRNTDGTFSLKADNGHYMSVEPDGGIYSRAGAIDTWEKLQFVPILPELFHDLFNGKIVGLLNYPNGKFFSINQDENYQISADAKDAKIWEKLRIITTDQVNFSFQADNGDYLTIDTADKRNILRANAKTRGINENFQIFAGKSEDEAYLKAANDKFVQLAGGVACANSDKAVRLALKVLPSGKDDEVPEIISKTGLNFSFVSDFTKEWSSAKLGVAPDVLICRPKVPKGWFFVGDVVSIGENLPGYSAIIVKDTGNEADMIKPLRYEEIWNDKSAKKSCQHVSFWRPIPPKGYVAMGLVVTRDYKDPASLPSFENFRCIASRHVVRGRASRPVWNNRNSGSDIPLSLFVPGRDEGDTTSIPAGTFAHGFYDNASVGGGGGGANSDLAPGSDWYLAGFQGRNGASLDGIVPVYRSFSDPEKTSNGIYRGGGGGGEFSEIARKGYAVSGIVGHSTGVVNQIKIQFMKIDGLGLEAKSLYEGAKLGYANGSEFSLGGHGCLFQGVDLRSGSLIDAMNLIPMPATEVWVIPGKTKEELRQEVASGVVKLYLEKKLDEIDSEARQEFLKKYPKIADVSSPEPQPENKYFPDNEIPDLKLEKQPDADESAPGAPKDSGSPDSITTTTRKVKDGLKNFNVSNDVQDFVEKVTGFLGFDNPKAALNGTLITLSADMRIKLTDKIKLKFGLEIDVPLQNIKERGVVVRAVIPGEWKNPLGISGLVLKEMGFGGNIAFNAKKPNKIDPTLFVKGAMDIGLSGPVEMLAAYDPTSPGVDGMIGQLQEISWSEVVKIANFFLRLGTGKTNASLPTPDFPIDIIKVQQANFMVAKKKVENLDLEMGTRLRGDFVVDNNVLGNVEVLFSPDGETTAVARLNKQKIGALEISTPEGFNSSRGGPICTIVHKKDKNKFSVLGMVKVGTSNLTFYQELEKDAKVSINGNLGGVLPATLLGQGKLNRKSILPSPELELTGSVDSSYTGILQNKVVEFARKTPAVGSFLAAFGNAIIQIDSISLKASLKNLAQAKLPELKVNFKISGKSFSISLPNVSVTQIETKMIDKIAEVLIRETASLAAEFARILGETVAKYSKEIASAANEVADAAVKAYEESEKVVNEAVNSIGNFSVDAGNQIKNYGEKSLAAAVNVGKAIGNGLKKLKFW